MRIPRNRWGRAARLSALALVLALGLGVRAEAGQGRVRAVTDPDGRMRRVLDLTVYFAYDVAPGEYEAWKPVFREASKLLFDATEEQVRFGEITFTNSTSLRDKADIWVKAGLGGATSATNAFGNLGQRIYLSQLHQCTGEPGQSGVRADAECEKYPGQFGIVHELGHYLFGLYDEYKGCEHGRADTCEGKSLRRLPSEYFCATVRRDPQDPASPLVDSPVACIMDGGTTVSPNNTRREFCMALKYDSPFTHRPTRIVVDTTDRFNRDKWTWYANGQEATLGLACWSQMAAAPKLRLSPPIGEPKPQVLPPAKADGSTWPDEDLRKWMPSFRIVDQAPGVVLALDASNSMNSRSTLTGQTRLDLAKQGARNAVDLMKADEPVGMVRFGNSAVRDVALSESTETQKAAMRDAIDAIVASDGGTAMGDALDQAAAMLDGYRRLGDDGQPLTEPLSAQVVILLSDGASNRGRRPLDALAELQAKGRVTVHTIALGGEADRTTLSKVAHGTGGEFFSVDDAAGLTSILPRVLSFARGEVGLSDVADILGEDDARNVVRVPQGVRTVTFTLGYEPDLPVRLSVTTPPEDGARGVEVDLAGSGMFVPSAPGDGAVTGVVNPAVNKAQQFIRVTNPPAGEWTVDVDVDLPPAGDPSLSKTWHLVVTTESPDVELGVHIPVQSRVEFPGAVPIHATVTAEFPLGDVDVLARVHHPGGAVTDGFRLYDDGRLEHGDLLADDGIYSNMFNEYRVAADGGGSGTYLFEVRAENTGQAREVSPSEDRPDEVLATSVPPFVLTGAASVYVSGVPSVIGPATALVPGGGRIDPPLTLLLAQLDANPVIPFAITAGNEPLLLYRVPLESAGTADDTLLDEICLYDDVDGNGKVDNKFLALARARFSTDDGSVVFMDPSPEGRALARIEAGTTRHFIVALGAQQAPIDGDVVPFFPVTPKPAARGTVVPAPPWEWWLAGLALWLLAVSRVLGPRRVARPLTVGAGVLLAVVLTGVIGCGGGGGGVSDGLPQGQAVEGTLDFTMAPTEMGLVGTVQGTPIQAQGEAFSRLVTITVP